MTKSKKPQKQQIEKEIEIEVTYVCPVRGRVTEKVKGYKIKTQHPMDEDIEELIKISD